MVVGELGPAALEERAIIGSCAVLPNGDIRQRSLEHPPLGGELVGHARAPPAWPRTGRPPARSARPRARGAARAGPPAVPGRRGSAVRAAGRAPPPRGRARATASARDTGGRGAGAVLDAGTTEPV